MKQPTSIAQALQQVDEFKGLLLANTVGQLESRLQRATLTQLEQVNYDMGISDVLLKAAAMVKRASAEINVVIHTVGILYSLPHLLRPAELIISTSLGAGNSGSEFDVVTDQRIAEFKFQFWQKGANALRKKTLFQDYYRLARNNTQKEKYLYVTETQRPLNFLQGKSSVKGIMDRNRSLWDDFNERFGGEYETVGEFYRRFADQVQVVNLYQVVPDLARVLPREVLVSDQLAEDA